MKWSGSDLYCTPYKKLFINKVYSKSGVESKETTQALKDVCDSSYSCSLSRFSSSLDHIRTGYGHVPATIEYYCGFTPDDIYKIFDAYLVHDVNNITGAVEYCKSNNKKRRYANSINQNLGGVYRLEDLILLFRTLGDARAFGFESSHFIPTPQNATEYTVRYTLPHGQDNQPITLPIHTAATIRYHHTINSRPTIPEDVRTQLSRMDRMSDDDAGHILAHSLGGPTIPTNFIPMNRDVNRIRGNWYRTEDALRAYLNHERQGHIYWEALIIYRNDFTSYRPIALVVRYTLFDGHGQQAGEPEIRTFLNDVENFQNGDCTFGLNDFFIDRNDEHTY